MDPDDAYMRGLRKEKQCSRTRQRPTPTGHGEALLAQSPVHWAPGKCLCHFPPPLCSHWHSAWAAQMHRVPADVTRMGPLSFLPGFLLSGRTAAAVPALDARPGDHNQLLLYRRRRVRTCPARPRCSAPATSSPNLLARSRRHPLALSARLLCLRSHRCAPSSLSPPRPLRPFSLLRLCLFPRRLALNLQWPLLHKTGRPA